MVVLLIISVQLNKFTVDTSSNVCAPRDLICGTNMQYNSTMDMTVNTGVINNISCLQASAVGGMQVIQNCGKTEFLKFQHSTRQCRTFYINSTSFKLFTTDQALLQLHLAKAFENTHSHGKWLVCMHQFLYFWNTFAQILSYIFVCV